MSRSELWRSYGVSSGLSKEDEQLRIAPVF